MIAGYPTRGSATASAGWMSAGCALTLALATALGAGAGCSTNTNVAAPRSFDRPDALALVCFVNGKPADLDRCSVVDDQGTLPTNSRLHALVAQTTRGEIAAVDLSTGTILDSDVRIPGFTFVPVGEVPAEIVIPPTDPACTYVANRGSGTLLALSTQDFRDGRGLGTLDELILPSGSLPTAMIPANEGSTLIVALPDRGQIAFVEVSSAGCDPDSPSFGAPVFGEVQFLNLRDEIPPAVDLNADGVEPPPAYQRLKREVDGGVQAIEETLVGTPVNFEPRPTTNPEPGTHARPWALTVVEEQSTDQTVLLVADVALPILHRVDLGSRTEITAINVGVPTRDVVVTPLVPTDEDDLGTFTCDLLATNLPVGEEGSMDLAERCLRRTCTSGNCQRYLYAIDDQDGTVLAVDYTEPNPASMDPAATRFGAVLPVSAGLNNRSDRIVGLPATARALEVIVPGIEADRVFPDETASNCPETSSGRMQGVFLSVALADGSVRFVDIWDRDAPCRISAQVLQENERVYIQRHRPRISGTVSNAAEVTATPSFSIGPNTDDGLDELGAITTCPEGLSPVLTREVEMNEMTVTDTVICAIDDPWEARSETWLASYEGLIPFATNTGGRFNGDTVIAQMDACSLGVLGSANVAGSVPADDPLVGYVGDMLVITGSLPPRAGRVDEITDDQWDDCVALVGGDEAVTEPIEIPILNVAIEEVPTGVVLSHIELLSGDPMDGGVDLADVRTCFNELITFEIHAQQSYVVRSSRVGASHSVVRGAVVEGMPTRACELDPALLAVGHRMRAFYGQTFTTPLVSFAIQTPPPNADTADPEMRFSIGNIPGPVFFDLGSPSVFGGGRLLALPSRLLFNPTDGDLYAVDQARRGLVEMSLDPLSAQRSFE